MRKLCFVLLFCFPFSVNAQTLSLVFAGDIMAHDKQLMSVKNGDEWDFKSWFSEIEHIFKSADYCIGNLEVPLGVKPFKGYPSFGSPAQLAVDLKSVGFNVLLTANNHAADRMKKGVISTAEILDSINILHTGTWQSETIRKNATPLILEKNGICIALLNYTYATNGIAYPKLISYMKEELIKQDIENAKLQNPDKIIVCIHWGTEYQSYPTTAQKSLAKKIHQWGGDYIIGAHPHVIQPMEWTITDSTENFVAYSLGNLVSNMTLKRTDGGALLHLRLEKIGDEVSICQAEYSLMYVYKYFDENKRFQYRLLPIHEYENKPDYFKNNQYDKMLTYKKVANAVMEKNINVLEWYKPEE